MASTPDDRRRAVLSAVVAATAVAAFFAWQMFLGKNAIAATTAVPSTADFASLAAYLTPVTADSSSSLSPTATIVIPRDPFSPPPVHASAAPTTVDRLPITAAPDEPIDTVWAVTAVLVAENRRAAVVDDVLVNVGGHLPDGSRLSEVAPHHVVITDVRGGRHTLVVREPNRP